MSNFISLAKYLGLFVAAFVLGLGAWYFRQTNPVTNIILDAIPLAQDADLTNIAILGIGGEGHDGGDLTDTILLVSLRHSDSSIKLISVPRDIWVKSLNIKINAAYHYGQLPLVQNALKDVLGIPIHYSLVIDFSGFVKLIDVLGGVDVDVVRSFDDYKYPIPGQENAEPESARYEHLHFDQGWQHLDGITALKYARSRHAEGEEGTDFARGERQQQIVTALKDKILSSQTLLNIKTLSQIVDSLKSSLETNISPSLYRSFFDFGLSFRSRGQSLTSGSLTTYLTNPRNLNPYGGAWVLLPSDKLKAYVATFLAQ